MISQSNKYLKTASNTNVTDNKLTLHPKRNVNETNHKSSEESLTPTNRNSRPFTSELSEKKLKKGATSARAHVLNMWRLPCFRFQKRNFCVPLSELMGVSSYMKKNNTLTINDNGLWHEINFLTYTHSYVWFSENSSIPACVTY